MNNNTQFTRVDIDVQEQGGVSFVSQSIDYSSHAAFLATAAAPDDSILSATQKAIMSFMCLCEIALGYGYASEHSYVVRSSHSNKIDTVPAEIPEKNRLVKEYDASGLVTVSAKKVPYSEYADVIRGITSCQMSDISLLSAAQIILSMDNDVPVPAGYAGEDIYEITTEQLRDAQTYIRGYASEWIKAVTRLKKSLEEHITDMIVPSYSLKLTDDQTIPLDDLFALDGFPTVKIGQEDKFTDDVSNFIKTSYPGSTLIISSAGVGEGSLWDVFFQRYPTLLRLLSASFITEG